MKSTSSRQRAGLRLCAAVATAAALSAGCSTGEPVSDDSQPSASSTPTEAAATPSPSATAPANSTEPAPDGSVGTVELPAVSTGTPVEVQQGLVVEVPEVEATNVEAHAPGDIAGPGITVLVRITNHTAAPVNLADVAVTAHYGDEPASPISGGDEFTTTLQPGATATGTYPFRDPDDTSGPLSIRIEYNRSQNVVIVTP